MIFKIQLCFRTLEVNNEQITTGIDSDDEHFWFDRIPTRCVDNNMITSELTIQNGQVTSSVCDETSYGNVHLIWYSEILLFSKKSKN